jgi:hypothetical protein
MILEPWHSHLCKKNSQMSCYVDIKLEPLRWSKIAGKFLHYDIEAFLRHHPVKPREVRFHVNITHDNHVTRHTSLSLVDLCLGTFFYRIILLHS